MVRCQRLILVGVALAMGVLARCPVASAQAAYNAAGGTISPWMNMFQRHPGPLDNYNSYVRPQLELQRAVNQQNVALQRQGSQIQTLRLGMEEAQEATIPVTGTGSTFMNYSHYYPQKGVGGGNMASRTTSRPASSYAPRR
jgi:hypothetical protein